jgi:putative transposase
VVSNLEQGGAVTKHRVVDAMRSQYGVRELCELLNISRSGYYKYVQRMSHDRDAWLKEKIRAIYMEYQRIYGYRQVQMQLERQYQIKANHKRVLRLMQQMGLRSIIRRRRQWLSGCNEAIAGGRVAENLLQRNFSAKNPDHKWVTDVTQYRIGDRRLYLSAIQDLFNNEIVAYHISERNDNPLVIESFHNAFEKRKDVAGLIVHSDQGFQYTSHAYHDMLQKVGAQTSMSRRGNCLDNACIESFFSHLKTEALYPYHIKDLAEAQSRIEAYIRFYNEERAQHKLNKLTPVEYRHQLIA